MEAAKNAGKDDAQQTLQARQTYLRMLSLLCFCRGPLDTNSVAAMLRLIVLGQHGLTFLDDPVQAASQAALLARCVSVMAARTGAVCSSEIWQDSADEDDSHRLILLDSVIYRHP